MSFDLARALERDTSQYMVRGQRVPSVTEALSIAGLCSFDGVPEHYLAEAAHRGKIAHAITAELDKGKDVGTIPDNVVPYVAAYEKFRRDTDFEPHLIEHVVVNERHRYAGTFDRLGRLNGHLALIDLKCSMALYPWVGLQLAGYELALPEALRAKRPKRYSLRLMPDETYRLHQHRDHSDALDFVAALRVTHFQLTKGGIAL